MINYKKVIAESMIVMMERAVHAKDVVSVRQIISNYFTEAKLSKRFMELIFEEDNKDITIREMVYHMVDGTTKQFFEQKNLYNVINESVDDKAVKGDGDEYRAFFKKALTKFGVKKPGDLEGDKERDFYNYIDKNWKADDEVNESRSSRDIDVIAKMTKRNDHIEALIAGAKYLKQKKLERVFMGIEMIQDAEGSLTNELGKLRYKYYKDMMKFAKSKLTSDEYDKFYAAF